MVPGVVYLPSYGIVVHKGIVDPYRYLKVVALY